MRPWLLAAFLLTCGALSAPLAAQTAEPAPPHLSYVDGRVDLRLDGEFEPATPSTALLDGDQVITATGRAELVFADGTLVHLDHGTTVEVMWPSRLRVTEGRLVVRTSAASADFVIDTAAASLRLDARGEYVINADDRRSLTMIGVSRGYADAETWNGTVGVGAGDRLEIDDRGQPRRSGFNTARWDAFERWAAARADGMSRAASARQLPYELHAHAPVLDRYGHWGYDASYGAVWYPRVTMGWRPYMEGRWRHTRYGWTWVGHDPWAWPTHHYGRWGFSAGVWFWIPARTWAPAWVSWAYAPGYVSWAPLGWDGRPVIALQVGVRGSYDPWRAWTVLPLDRLGHRSNLRTWAVDGRRLPAQVGGRWDVRPTTARPAERWTDTRGGARVPSRAGTSQPDPRRAVPRAGARDLDRRDAAGGGLDATRSPRTGDRRAPRAGEREAPAGATLPGDPSGDRIGAPGAPSAATRVREQWTRENAERAREAERPAPRDRVEAPDRFDAPGRFRSPEGPRERTTGGREPAPPDSAGPPPSRGDDGRRAAPRGEAAGDSRGGGRDAPAARGGDGSRQRPGAVRRPPGP